MENTENFKPSYLNRKLITFICDGCGKESVKPSSEYNRNIKSGKKNFCCQSCAASYNNKHRARKTLSESQKLHLQTICSNHRDEFSPFRYTLRCVKRRFKDIDINLDYLKEVWEEQRGICPYTGIKLTLPEDCNIKNLDVTERASLDRIDSSLGYVRGNIQFISTPINYMKNEMSDLLTKDFLKRISSFTSSFEEDLTISSPSNEGLDAQAGN